MKNFNWKGVVLVSACFALGAIWWACSSAGVLPAGPLSSPFPGFALMGLAFSVGVGRIMVPAQAKAEVQAEVVREASVIYYPEDQLEVVVEAPAVDFFAAAGFSSPVSWSDEVVEAPGLWAAQPESAYLFEDVDDPMSFGGDPEMQMDSLSNIDLEDLKNPDPFNTPAPWTISAQIERLQRSIEEDESRHEELLANATPSRFF